MPSFLSCSALSMSSGDGNVSGNVTISFWKQQLDKKLWGNVCLKSSLLHIMQNQKHDRLICIKCGYFEERVEEYLSQWLRGGEMAVTGADLESGLETLYGNLNRELCIHTFNFVQLCICKKNKTITLYINFILQC